MISRINDSLQELTKLFVKSTKGNFQQRNYAKKLLENILTLLLRLENENRRLKTIKSNIDQSYEYDTALLKCVDVLKVLGVNMCDMTYIYKKPYIEFIINNKSQLGNIDKKRLNNICQIIRYYEVTREQLPNNLSDLKTVTDEIKELRSKNIDVDQRISEVREMNNEQLKKEFEKEWSQK